MDHIGSRNYIDRNQKQKRLHININNEVLTLDSFYTLTHSPSLARLPFDDPILPTAVLCDRAIEGLDAPESTVSTVTVVEVPSLMLTVSIEPNANDILSLVVELVVVTIELR